MKNIKIQTLALITLLVFTGGCNTADKSQSDKYDQQLKDGWSVESSVKVNATGDIISTEKLENASLKANSSLKIYSLPADKDYSKVYFLSLQLAGEQGNAVADNFYWLSTKKDVPDFKNTTWFYTPLSGYADFTDLDKLPKAKTKIESAIKNEGDEYEVTVTLNNPGDNIAFLIELSVVGDKSIKQSSYLIPR